MLAAVGLPLLDAPECGKPSGSTEGGDYGGVVAARETSVTVREIDRRVLLVHVAVEVGLVTCVCEVGFANQPDIPLQ